MTNMFRNLVAVLVVTLLLTSCLSKTQRVAIDTDEPFDSTETSSKDLEAVVQKMTRSLILLPQIQNAKTPPRLAFLEVTNNTNEILNKELFLNKMRTLLIKNSNGKMIFLDRAKIEAIKREREAKRSGEFTSNSSGSLSGADYFLTGTLDSIDKAGGGKRSTYTRYAFRLTNAETGDIYWEDDYEVKKVGSAGLYDR